MHEVDHRFHRIDRRFGKNAVPQIENVARPPLHFIENALGVLKGHFFRCKKNRGIHVPLNRSIVAGALPPIFNGGFPIEPDDRSPGFALKLKERIRAGSEMDHRHPRLLHIFQNVGHVRLHIFFVVGGRELANPRVKELNAIGAGFYLLSQIAANNFGELLHQHVPRGGLAVHHLLRFGEVSAFAPFDQIARESERRPRKPDERNLDLFFDHPQRGHHIAEPLFRIDHSKLFDLRHFANRLVNNRPLSFCKLERSPHRLKGEENIGEQNGGIDPEAQRLKGDLSGELRIFAELEKGVLLAQRSILRHVAPRLAHHPHRRAVDGFTAACAQKAIVHVPDYTPFFGARRSIGNLPVEEGSRRDPHSRYRSIKAAMAENPPKSDGTVLQRPLVDLAVLFVRLGLTAFGGPAAHIAMMEEEVVRRRGWLSSEEFLDLIGATNLIPGPNSTEMAIHIGRKRAGWAGLLVAGTCFIVPAALITFVLAWVYVRFGKIPEAAGVLYGVKPVMIAIVFHALWKLGRTAIKTVPLAGLGAAATVAALLGVEELLVLLGGGFAGWLLREPRAFDTTGKSNAGKNNLVGVTSGFVGAAGLATTTPASSWSLLFVFAKIGSVLFGSGYVLLAFLRSEFVTHRHWMTETQLLDAVAVGQLTPGPVFTTSTFVGYVINGPSGAIAATVGVFLPSFVFVALSGCLIPKVRASKGAGAFLDGVNVASLALMAIVGVQLGRAAFVDPATLLIGAGSAALLLNLRVNSAWLIVSGAIIGTATVALR